MRRGDLNSAAWISSLTSRDRARTAEGKKQGKRKNPTASGPPLEDHLSSDLRSDPIQRSGVADGEHGEVDAAVAAPVRGDAVAAGDVPGQLRLVGAHDHRRRIHQLPPLPPPPHLIGNYQEASGIKTGWGAVVVAELVALIVAGTVHRVCITTCFLFSVGLLYEVDKLSGMILARSESKARRY